MRVSPEWRRMATISIVDTARLLTGHRQHRRYRPGDQARGGHFGRPDRSVQTGDCLWQSHIGRSVPPKPAGHLEENPCETVATRLDQR